MRELLRRFLALGVLCTGFAALPTMGLAAAAISVVIAIVLYAAIPALARPRSAFIYERVPAVYGPDLLGFLLIAVFFALPFWARSGEAYLWEDFGPLVHPAALMSWPLALISAAILWFSAHYAAFWLVIEEDGLRINRVEGERLVAFPEIAEVKPFRRGLPNWLRWLAPVMVAMGRPGAAGAILLARDTTGISLVLADGSTIAIHKDAFEDKLRRVLKALRGHGVAFAPELRDVR